MSMQTMQTNSFNVSVVDHGDRGRDVRFEYRDGRPEKASPVAPVLELIEELSAARSVIAKLAEGDPQVRSTLSAYLAKYGK